MMRVASLRKKGPVVGDEQDRPAVAQQKLFEPADRVDVEVIGRLVQQQNVGAADQGLGQQHAAFHAGREVGHVGIGFERHARDDRLDLLVHRPAAVDFQGVLDAVEPGPQFVAPSDGQLVRQAVILGQQFGPGPQSAGDLVEHRAAEPLRHFLREHGGDEPLLPGDFAPRRLDFALDQPQERGLARSVAAQQADPLARLKREVGLIQHQRAAKAQS